MSINLSSISISNNKSSDYCFIISLTNKNEVRNLVQNACLTKKTEFYKNYTSITIFKAVNF